jgi:ABC-type sulfate transport system permease subunit
VGTKKSDPISKEKIFTALLSGVLLTIFALTMTMALGIKAPLDFSVFSAPGGALLLGMCTDFPFSLDELVRRNRPEAPHAFAKLVVDVDRF